MSYNLLYNTLNNMLLLSATMENNSTYINQQIFYNQLLVY